MKICVLMETNIKISPIPSLNPIPDPVPKAPSSYSPSSVVPHTIPPTTPPPLMSIVPLTELDQAGPNSPPRKWRKKEIKYIGGNQNRAANIFDKSEENWQRFYVMKKKDGDFTTMSPFLYCMQIIQAVGKPKSVQRMGSGALNIEAANIAQAKALLQLKKLGDNEVSIESNKRLNTSRGVVVCRDFMICSEDEIKTGMADQGVIDVKRINRRQGGTLVATASLILTFDTPDPPEQIVAAYYKLKVRKFIPSPMRCFKCLKFGHTSLRCRSAQQMCACGLTVHEDAPCQEPPICVNCADLHNSRSPECLIFQEEKEIQRVKTLQNMPYREARELVKSKSFVKPSITYAAVAKSKQEERKDWQKIIQPFIFSGLQGPSKPVWAHQSSGAKENVTSHPEVGTSHPPSSSSQGKPLASPPTPLLSVAAAGSRAPGPRAPVRLTPTRLPPRSPPRKERTARQALATKSLLGTRRQETVEEHGVVTVATPESHPQPPRKEPINWVSSREEHGSDSETADSNRTVLTDNGQAPVERPVVRRKRKSTLAKNRK